MAKKILTLINYVLIIIAVLGSYYFVFTRDKELGLILKDASIILTITLPYLIEKLFHQKIAVCVKSCWVIFIFLAQFLGVTVELYNEFAYFDKFTHWLSGIITSLLALMLLSNMNMYYRKIIVFNIIWMLSITLAVAACWEIFEYSANIFFGGDAQRVALTGVNDTMQDMIVAFLGGLVTSIIYLYEAIKNKKGLVSLFVNK